MQRITDQIRSAGRNAARALFMAVGLQLCGLGLMAAVPLTAPPSPLYVTNRSAAQLASALGVTTNLSGLYVTNTSAAALVAALGVPTNGGAFTGSGALLTNLSINSITGNFSGTFYSPISGWATTNGDSDLVGTGSYHDFGVGFTRIPFG